MLPMASLTTQALPPGPCRSAPAACSRRPGGRLHTNRNPPSKQSWPRCKGVAGTPDCRVWHATEYQAGKAEEPWAPELSRTFRIHRLLQDNLHPLHMVPVPEAVQGLAVLISEGQDLSHGLSGRKTGHPRFLGERGLGLELQTSSLKGESHLWAPAPRPQVS